MRPTTLFMFDVDGTVTDLTTKTIREPDIVRIFSTIVTRGDILAFNTGRALSWIHERIYAPFISSLGRRLTEEECKRVIVVGEKGGSWMTYLPDGSAVRGSDTSLVLPKHVITTIEEIAKQYPESMFFDSAKEVIVSIEMNDGMDMELYKGQQQKILTQLSEVLLAHNLSQTYRIVPSKIVIDIEHTAVGKRFGVERCMELLRHNDIEIHACVSSGDMKVDVNMAEWCWDKRIPVKFVYVGVPDDIQIRRYIFPIIVTEERYDKGFAQYFTKLLKIE